MILTAFTLLHVLISLAAIIAGFVVVAGLLSARRPDGWTTFFLTTTAATSVTGFLFPFHRFLPSHAVGIVSLLVLPVAVYALYGRRLAGLWRPLYVTASMFVLYLNVFVLVAQSFAKVPALKALAPTQSEPPFVFAQAVLLLLFVVVTLVATFRFHPERPMPVPVPVPLPVAVA